MNTVVAGSRKRSVISGAVAAIAIAGMTFGLTACHDDGSTSDVNRTAHICNGITLLYQHWQGGEVTGKYVQIVVPNSAECIGNVPGQLSRAHQSDK